MTTSSPEIAVRVYDEAKSHGCFALDAPVSGGDVGARNATLSVMVGGDKEVVDAVTPLLMIMGKNIVHQGKAGAGQHCKVRMMICRHVVVMHDI